MLLMALCITRQRKCSRVIFISAIRQPSILLTIIRIMSNAIPKFVKRLSVQAITARISQAIT